MWITADSSVVGGVPFVASHLLGVGQVSTLPKRISLHYFQHFSRLFYRQIGLNVSRGPILNLTRGKLQILFTERNWLLCLPQCALGSFVTVTIHGVALSHSGIYTVLKSK